MKSINEKLEANYHVVFVHAERTMIARFSFSSGDLHSLYENMIDFLTLIK